MARLVMSTYSILMALPLSAKCRKLLLRPPMKLFCAKTALQSNQHHVQGLLPKHIACHKQRDQAATIDQVVLNFGPVTLPAYLPAWIVNM